MDDILAFHRYHFAHSRTIQNQKYLVIALVSFLVLGASVVVDSDIPTATLLVAGIAFSLLFGVIFHFTFTYSLERQARKLLSEGRTDGMLGTHELEIDTDGLTERTDVNESRQVWSAFDRIEETDDYAFLYISSIQAHVIPKNNVAAGDPDQFIDRVRTLFASSQKIDS